MNDKVMLITGATSGIGRATAVKAAQAGMKLILTGRRDNKLADLVAEIGQEQAFALAADATQFTELAQVVEQGVAHWGRLNAVFANAGTGLNTSGTEAGDWQEWDQLIDVNIKALLWTAKLTLPHLHKCKGHFLLTSSAAGRAPIKGSIYGASKWFTYGFGQNLAAEMSQWGGRCTSICPGMVNTPFFDEPKPDKLDPTDVAEAVMYAVNADPRNTVREVFLMPTN